MGWKVFLALVLLGVVFISGCTEPPDQEAETVKDSLTEWLGTGQGTGQFPGGVSGEPIRVWKEGETLYWIAPIKNAQGLYIGNIITDSINFTFPKQTVKFSEPRQRILNCTQEEAYQLMILESGYPAYQIERPILVSTERGISWYSRVKSGNEVLDELYIKTFTIF